MIKSWDVVYLKCVAMIIVDCLVTLMCEVGWVTGKHCTVYHG